MDILTPVLIVGSIGILAGIILAIASIIMAVPKDEKAEALEEVLPGANCGACGYSGCSGYAAAMSKGEAEIGLCPPGGEAVSAACAKILGAESVSIERKTAIVSCMGTCDKTSDKMIYDGIKSCAAASALAGSITNCRFGCIGLGDCQNACEYDAISLCNGIALIDPNKCKACNKCVLACPKNLIQIAPLKTQAIVKCSNCDRGAFTMKACSVGCIGCMKCVKTCPVSAIEVKNFCATVDPTKCTGCGLCVEACPKKVIDMLITA